MKTPDGFDIKYIFFAYVPPHNDEVPSASLQTEVLKSENKITEYLFKIFDKAIDEARVEILFNSEDKQNNKVRLTYFQ